MHRMENSRRQAVSDIRLRLLTLCVLSIVSFTAPAGAALTFVWWLVFAAKKTVAAVSLRKIIGICILICLFPSVIIMISSGTLSAGLIYGFQISVLLLLALWFGTTYQPGEFCSFFVWLFGNGIGFDMGLAADFAASQLTELKTDAAGFMRSLRLKGKKLTARTFASFAFCIFMLALRRADLSSRLLARRGYTGGGTFCPLFDVEKSDIIRAAAAAIVAAAVVVPALAYAAGL